MTRPRATTSPSDALGATIADLKARLARLENIAHQHNTPASDFVRRAGDTMTGELILPGDPVNNLGAATKQYADSKVAKSGDTMSGVLSMNNVPSGTFSRRMVFGEGYELFADNAGPGSANNRLWFQSPDGGAIYLGPRAGPESVDLIELRGKEVNAAATGPLGGRFYENGVRVVEQTVSGGVSIIRFSDGTMIQYQRTLVGQTITATYGSLFIGSRVITFPVAFVGQPSVAIGAARWGTGASWGNTFLITSTSFQIRFYDILARSTTTPSTEIAWIGTGRWS